LIERGYDSAAEVLDLGECVHLASSIERRERLTDLEVQIRRREMPRPDHSVCRQLGDELVERDAVRVGAIDVVRHERGSVTRVEDRYDVIRAPSVGTRDG